MKSIILLILIFVSILFFICLKKDIVQALPEAELGKPYFYSIDISDGQRTYPDHFIATVTPKNSGLNVSLGGEWENEAVVSGTPKVQQDILIEVFYVIRGPIGLFEDAEQTKFYRIKVRE